MGRVYKAEFRHEAVRLALSSGLSRERIAALLHNSVYWRDEAVIEFSVTRLAS